MSHWTYKNFLPTDDLQQGDIIRRTPQVIQILTEVHNHFIDEKYSAFIVLSQTCDLVRRDGRQCSSRYINLAVIRPLDGVLPILLDGICEGGEISGARCQGFYTKESKTKAQQFIERVLNQNEAKTGLFYLHPDVEAGIVVGSVAFLQVGIALRRSHYEALMDARCGRLNDDFQHRLGWLYGHLFSRVGVKDWDEETRLQMTSELLQRFAWFPASVFETAAKKGISSTESFEDLSNKLSTLEKAPPIDMAIKRTVTAIRQIMPEVAKDKVDKIVNILKVDNVYTSVIKPQKNAG